MRTHLRLKNRQVRKLPKQFQDQDVRYTEELVATFLRQYTQPGDLVLDPFAGFGTTLIAAEAMDRQPLGIEYDKQRVAYVRTQLQQPQRIIHGDSRQIANYNLPPCDFSITSPPFMAKNDPEDPFRNYAPNGPGYAAYLRTLTEIYQQISQIMKPGARVVLEVANLKEQDGVTTLAWDIGRELSTIMTFEGEIIIGWDNYNYGYDHSYCLVFRCE
jgi:hypothetical protein